ncbi:MAG: type I methionyl aminopeptidase [Candidatus Omnitrophica bacterium]|nr:type I methionyl aminopeptidase [Candidatus Omnitrophota bacterium]
MTYVTSPLDLEAIRDSGRVLRKIFDKIEGILKPGVSTLEINDQVERWIIEEGAVPAFKGYRGYPSAICASVDEVVVHGIPSKDNKLKNGNIISIDIGVKKNKFYTDAAKTFVIGNISAETKELIHVTKDSLEKGIQKAVAGNRIGDISAAIEKVIAKTRFKEVRSFVGHGVGARLHEDPEVPNWGEAGKGVLLKEGLVLAIEPMVNAGTREVVVLDDGWTAITKDRKVSAHFEHTIIVGKINAEVLT